MRMSDNLLSTCEKHFLLQAINENKRLDGRLLEECRNATIHFGTDWGSCLVTLGGTRVLGQVSCDIQPPKASKPNEGLLSIHVEMSAVVALNFESNRQSDTNILLNRMLEKCLKESKCVDLEALCIVADEKVWNVRIDLNVMNYEGSLASCCSIAALAALAHFRHPDVTSTGEKIIIHSYSEKEPIKMNLHHYPVIISYALFNEGKHILADPTGMEEKVSDSMLLLCVNSYREICGMSFQGLPLPKSEIVLKCSRNAINTAALLVKQIKKSLDDDLLKRDSQKRVGASFKGLSESLDLDHIFSQVEKHLRIDFRREHSWKEDSTTSINFSTVKKESDEEEMTDNTKDESDSDQEASKYQVVQVAQKTAELTAKDAYSSVQVNKSMSEDDESDGSEDVQVIHECGSKNVEEIELSGDSEEDEVVVLESSYK